MIITHNSNSLHSSKSSDAKDLCKNNNNNTSNNTYLVCDSTAILALKVKGQGQIYPLLFNL